MTQYANRYKNLYQQYSDFDNLDEIMQAIEGHFADLFQLDVLDDVSGQGDTALQGSYFKFFDACMKRLAFKSRVENRDLSTMPQVITALEEILHEEPIKEQHLLKRLIFSPGQSQLGILEKIITGKMTANVGEPLTLLDLRRVLYGLNHMRNKNSHPLKKPFPKVDVIHLRNLPYLDINALKLSNQALFINFELDPRRPEKWGVLDLMIPRESRVYCETPLRDHEKERFESLFKFPLEAIQYLDPQSDAPQSTGYSAVAWFCENIRNESYDAMAWNFNSKADFSTTFSSFLLMLFGGDNYGYRLKYRCLPTEYNTYAHSDFKNIIEILYDSKEEIGNGEYELDASEAIRDLIAVASLGGIGDERFEAGNILRVINSSKLTKKILQEDLRHLALLAQLPGIHLTLQTPHDENNDPGYSFQETEEENSLKITSDIDYDNVKAIHAQACQRTHTNSSLFEYIYTILSDRYSERNDYAIAVLLFGFFRFYAKKPILNISLHTSFNLIEEDKQFIVQMLKANAHLTQLLIDENAGSDYNNQSLLKVKKELLPTLARNRWLKANDYLPPLVDDYWKKAAFYWLNYLHQDPTILEPQQIEDSKKQTFKRCVMEMGLEGLNAVLNYLTDPFEQENIQRLYGVQKPVFYLASLGHQFRESLDKLIEHIETKKYFPFRELGIAYQPGHDVHLAHLLGQMNNLYFEKLTLTDCLYHPHNLQEFLPQLIAQAQTQQWTSVISIPELDEKDIHKLPEALLPLQALYVRLNNVISQNRHRRAIDVFAKKWRDEGIMFDVVLANNLAPVPPERSMLLGTGDIVAEVEVSYPWGGAAEVEQQQQQEIQQEYLRHYDFKHQDLNVREDAFVGTLLEYNNIHREKNFEKYYHQFLIEYKAQGKLNILNAFIQKHSEQAEAPQQTLLRRWMSVKPNVFARDALHYWTQNAARFCVPHYRRLVSGFNPNNLTKGFYTQRAKDGKLALCYHPEALANEPNLFTLDLSLQEPMPEVWEGDFTLFDLEHRYRTRDFSTERLEEIDWEYIQLFALLQPKNQAEDNAQADHFFQKYKRFTTNQQDCIRGNWKICWQAWCVAGHKGVDEFLEWARRGFWDPEYQVQPLSLDKARDLLCQDLTSELKDWVKTLNLNEQYLRGLGQIYFRHGSQVMELFLRKLREVETAFKNIDADFFSEFNDTVIGCSQNFNQYINESGSFFAVLDDMVKTLRESPAQLNIWKKISTYHMASVGWDSVEQLWKAFAYSKEDDKNLGFIAQLKDMGLTLEGHEFDFLAPEQSPGNIVVLMERILDCIQHIPNPLVKRQFLSSLKDFGLNHGDVYYAIVLEGFKFFKNLKLRNFEAGTPTYRPELKDIYDGSTWPLQNSSLQMRRALASQTNFDEETYEALNQRFQRLQLEHKDELILLVCTQHGNNPIHVTLQHLNECSRQAKQQFARYLHHAVYHLGLRLNVSFDAVMGLASFYDEDQDLMTTALSHAPIVFDVLTIQGSLHKNYTDHAAIKKILKLFESPLDKPRPDYPNALYWDAYKLCTLFGINDTIALQAFYQATLSMPARAYGELDRLIAQILSIDYEASDISVLNAENWASLLECITAMKDNSARASEERVKFRRYLREKGVKFKSSTHGAYIAIPTNTPQPGDMSAFPDHQKRLWNFLVGHIAVPDPSIVGNSSIEESLKPILQFFKGLQAIPKRYLNEVEPMLSILEKTKPQSYWTAQYFYGLLRALQVPNHSFPIALLKTLLEQEALQAQPIDQEDHSLETEFPVELKNIFQAILTSSFTRDQQALLCKMALFCRRDPGIVQHQMMPFLKNFFTPEEENAPISAEDQAARSYLLKILAKAKNIDALLKGFQDCRALLEHKGQHVHVQVQAQWRETSKFWLHALALNESVQKLRDAIQNTSTPTQEALILHIIAWSTLVPALEKEPFILTHQAQKLIARLQGLEINELKTLAHRYSRDFKAPYPKAEDISRLVKGYQRQSEDHEKRQLSEFLDDFEKNPYPEPRHDYAEVAATREADLERMILEAQVAGESPQRPLKSQEIVRVTQTIAYLTALEKGDLKVKGQEVAFMSQKALAQAFRDLSVKLDQNPEDDLSLAMLWAVIFRGLARTNDGQYLTLGQKYALIARDICIGKATTSILQVSTGDGKSNLIAARAMREAGKGKIINILTAKRTLVAREFKTYRDFYNYFDINVSPIEPKSPLSNYTQAQIHISTMGDLSLFFDHQSYEGQKITHVVGFNPKTQQIDARIELQFENQFDLLDEIDFTRFEQGEQIQYNYARPTGRTPKQLAWFYQAVNEFYRQNSDIQLEETSDGKQRRRYQPNDTEITLELRKRFKSFLEDKTYGSRERVEIVKRMVDDDLQITQWLQSAHQAHNLTWREDFTVLRQNIVVGEESYPLREIIPLSRDSQKMFGSTYSLGTQQLVAELLKHEAKSGELKGLGYIQDESQDFHTQPESYIISSRIAVGRMRRCAWEGFTGTISSLQAASLYDDTYSKTEVLYVPTNQQDLRAWSRPKFYNDVNERNEDIVRQVKACLANKESVLFACKSEQQVLDFYAFLQNHPDLSPAEKAQLISCTSETENNDDINEENNVDKMLERKRALEQWEHGQQQRGVIILAADKGRGDNLGVKAVIIPNLLDANNVRQVGGRTARQGEAGTVYQFYLRTQISREYQRCTDELERLGKFEAIELPKDVENDGDLAVFEKLKLYREYEESLKRAPSQAYRLILDQFSDWAMKLYENEALGDPDSQERKKLTEILSSIIAQIHKKWLSLVGDEAKVETIGNFIQELAHLLKHYYKQEIIGQSSDSKFELPPKDKSTIKLGAYYQKRQPTPEERAFASVCVVYSRLFNPYLSREQLDRISKNIAKLAENNAVLLSFANQLIACSSLAAFENILTIAVSNVDSQGHQVFSDANRLEYYDMTSLLDGLTENSRLRFKQARAKLHGKLQDYLAKDLLQADSMNAEGRVVAALPVYEYLASLSATQQEAWGLAYLQELKTTFRQVAPQILQERLSITSPMEMSRLKALWAVVDRYSDGGEASFKENLPKVERALRGRTEQRLRMLTQLEGWLSTLNPGYKKELFYSFCATMEQFKDGPTWESFTRLVKETQVWWNKDQLISDRYVYELFDLWTNLGNSSVLPEINTFIDWSLTLRGKSWFQVLSVCLKSLPGPALVQYQNKIRDFWNNLPQEAKKSQKLALLTEFVESFACWDKLTSTSNEELAQSLIFTLPPKNLQHLFQFTRENFDTFFNRPLMIDMLCEIYSKFDQQQDIEFAQKILLIGESHSGVELAFMQTSIREIYPVMTDMNQERRNEILDYIQTNPFVLNDKKSLDYLLEYYVAEDTKVWMNIFVDASALYHQDHQRYSSSNLEILFESLMRYKALRQDGDLTSAQCDLLLELIQSYLGEILEHGERFKRLLVLMPTILKNVSFDQTIEFDRTKYLLQFLIDEISADKVGHELLLDFVEDQQQFKKLLKLMPEKFYKFCGVLRAHHHDLLIKPSALPFILTCYEEELWSERDYDVLTEDLLVPASQAFQKNHKLNYLAWIQFIEKEHLNIAQLTPSDFENFTTFIKSLSQEFMSFPKSYSVIFKELLKLYQYPRLQPLCPLFVEDYKAIFDDAMLDKFIPLCTWLDKKRSSLLAVSEDKRLGDILELMLKYKLEFIDHFEQYSVVFDLIIQYADVYQNKPKHWKLLSELLLKLADFQVRHPHISLNNMLSIVDRLKDHGEILERLTVLVDNDETADVMPLLFEDEAYYFDHPVATYSNHLFETFSILSKATQAFKEKGRPIFQSPDVMKLFDFTNLKVRYERMILMRALYHQSYGKAIYGEEEKLEGNNEEITMDFNALQQGFDAYLVHAKKLLGVAPKNLTPSARSEFDSKQRTALLELADELEYISARGVFISSSESRQRIARLQKSMSVVVERYSAVLFKSADRERQLVDLESFVSHVDQFEGKDDHYAMMLNEIMRLESRMLSCDQESNSSRWWLKLNWTGQSRYLNTLNQLHDMIVRTWLNDPDAIGNFHRYKDITENHFRELVSRLHSVVGREFDEIKQQPAWNKRPGAIFAYQKHPIHDVFMIVEPLMNHLYSEEKEELNGSKVVNAMHSLKRMKTSGKLEQSLITLIDQVLMYGEAVASNLQAREVRAASAHVC